jgi:hypothetical protein
MANGKDNLIRRILSKTYKVSVDDGTDLVLTYSHSLIELRQAMLGTEDLLWIYDKHKNKLGWMKVNSKTGEILNYSERDKRIAELVAGEFLG